MLDFLFENPALSRISILGDYKNPAPTDNTAKTMKGFSLAVSDCGFREEEVTLFLFTLTAVMQSAFLRKGISREVTGYDLNRSEGRKAFVAALVDRMV